MKALSAIFKLLVIAAALQYSGGALAQTSIGERSGHIDWEGWSLNYETYLNADGLTISDVAYNGTSIINRASFPVMSVFYEQNACGPYADRLNGPQQPVHWANNELLVARQFTQGGEQWFELGIREFIGSYDIYQVWYLGQNGKLVAYLFSRGLQCNNFHEHYPMWRIDFDIEGSENDQIMKADSTGALDVMETEFEVAANTAYEHGWYVVDSVSGTQVRLEFDGGGWGVDYTVSQESGYANNTIGGMLFKRDEIGWVGGASREYPYDDGEDINGQDLVVWYRGYMPHTAEEGPTLWHATGLRISLLSENFDFDGDGIPNDEDPDDDNDGVPDTEDDLPLDPNEWLDTDGDGIGNNADTDDDGDGYEDSADVFPLDNTEWADTDVDGIGDNSDIDQDNDGIPNTVEGVQAPDLEYASESRSVLPVNGASLVTTVDLSASGLPIGKPVTIDNIRARGDLNTDAERFELDFNNGQAVLSLLQTGLQCSSTLDPLITDVEATVTIIDIGGGTPGITYKTTSTADVTPVCGDNELIAFDITGYLPGFAGEDSDSDGVPNRLDLDSDNDGLYDVAEGGGTDNNLDGRIDSADVRQGTLTDPPDSDGDGIRDYLDIQSDGVNHDIVGSLFESLDTNGDGVVNGADALGGQDENGNGIDDAIEEIASSQADTDNDGIVDSIDTDDDNDGVEDENDAFPLDPSESVDTDGDGIGNNADTDDDNDGVPDSEDLDPLDPTVGREATTSLSIGASTNGHVTSGEWHYYRVNVASDTGDLRITLSGLTDDADLYVRMNATPERELFDCRSQRSTTTDDVCLVSPAGSNYLIIGVWGYRETDYTLSVVELDSIDNDTIAVGETQSNTLALGEWQFLRIDNPAGVDSAEVEMFNLTADLDLYIKYDGRPSMDNFDCRSWSSSTTVEKCIVDFTTAENVYIGVRAYRAGSYSLKVTELDGGTGTGNVIEPSQFVTDTVSQGEKLYYTIANPAGSTQVAITLSQLQADVDLYVKTGSTPTFTNHDCQSIRSGKTTELCEVPLTSETTEIMVVGAANSAFKLSVFDPTLHLVSLQDGDSAINNMAANNWTFYHVAGDLSYANLYSKLANLSADLDLYVKRGSLPTDRDFDCRSYRGGTSEENCSVAVTDASPIYIGVYSYQAGSFKLIVSSVGLGAAEEEHINEGSLEHSGKLQQNKWEYHLIRTAANDTELFAELYDNPQPASLYIRRIQNPTSDQYDCGPDFYSNKDNMCHLTLEPTEGEQLWYIGVYSEVGTSYKLTARSSDTSGDSGGGDSSDSGDGSGDSGESGGDTSNAGDGSSDKKISTGGGALGYLILMLALVLLVRRIAPVSAVRNGGLHREIGN